MRRIALLLIPFLFVQACNLPTLGTAATPTAGVAPTDPPAATNTATAAEPEPTAIGGVALEAILITQPGPLSIVTSPVVVEGQSRPTFEQNLVVAVYDELGSLLAQHPTTIMADAGSPGPFVAEISFAVAVEQPGRISVYETSAMDGGIIHLSSVEVTLSPAAAMIQPGAIGLESIAIAFPPPNVEIPSGSIVVTGFSDYYFESHLGLMICGSGGSGVPHDLCGTEDNILVSGFALIDAPEIGLPGPFSGEVSFSVTEPTPARIVVFAASARDGGLLHVNSIPVLLVP